MKKCVLRAAALLLSAVILCIGCNALAFLIDTPQMRQNAWQGAQMLCADGGTPQMVGGFKSAQLDNFTAVLMIKTAAYTGDQSLMEKALGGYRAELSAGEGQSGWEAFCTYGDGSQTHDGGLSYTRYWHGYTLPLRLMLCVMDLANSQMLLYFVQTALFAAVLLLMARRGLLSMMPALFLAYFLIMPMAAGVCLQYAPASLVMLLSCCAVLAWDEKIHKAVSFPAFFALIGLVTNFVDLLTFPLITLGFPLVLMLALRLKKEDSFFRVSALTVACCAGWALGYGGMWVLKWVLAGAVFGWGRFYGIFTQIFLRVSSESNGERLSRLAVLKMNLDVILAKKAYLMLMLVTGAASFVDAVRRMIKGARFDLRALALLVPAAVPFAWCIVMANHSFDHTYFTYRNMTMAVLALYAMIPCLVKEKNI